MFEFILLKVFVNSMKHFFWRCLLKDAFKTVTAILWKCNRLVDKAFASKSACDGKVNTTWIIQTFKTSFVVYNVFRVMLLKNIEQSFFGIINIRIANQ